ncbi:MAG: antitoxin [Actinobacteria bacterium]|nr:antitoxin [Actinomycetota bacterium]
MPTRTTLTLEDDVAAQVRAEVHRTGKPFKRVVNEALRRGLDSSVKRDPSRFLVAPRDLGVKPGFDLDDVQGLIDRLEGTPHR